MPDYVSIDDPQSQHWLEKRKEVNLHKVAILEQVHGDSTGNGAAENHHEARLLGEITWGKFKKLMSYTNEHYLPGVFLDPAIRGYLDLASRERCRDGIIRTQQKSFV